MSELKRSLGLWQCTLMGVGVMLGAGIYALVGEAAGMAGNAVWISFALASGVALCTGLSYAELSSFIPKAGGQYYYITFAFGQMIGFLVSWLIQIGIAIGAAAVALAFGGYLAPLTGITPIGGASILIGATAFLLVYGIQETAWVAGLCTAVELIGLGIVIVVGLPELGSVNYLETAESGSAGVLSAAALVFFAFIGFEQIAQLGEETVQPTRVIPATILLSILITALLYVSVALCSISVLGWEALGQSDAPLADVAEAVLGNSAFLAVSVIALFSTGNTVLIFLLSGARLLYGMAEDGALPRQLAAIHRTQRTPYVASLTISGAALLIVWTMRDLSLVANLTNFALLFAFVVVNGAVISLRFTRADQPRPFRIPLNLGVFPLIPLVGMASSALLIYYIDWKTILTGLGFVALGILTWTIRQRANRKEIPANSEP